MAGSLMDVFVKIGADTSGLEEGIGKAKGLAGGLGSAVSSGLKVAGAAIGAATTAVTGFAASSVQVGQTFDASMAQVAATMGVTVDEIGDLRDYAMEMGAKTAFSATQAADALNYMALAGYSADQSMEMLPNVLNLAAAGDMELARASDMVTDAQSALGLSMEDMSGFVDQMAKTASKSNTSVAQLGDAILTVGGTAKTLAGGTTELNTVLGILADNGIKGAEGGTHLRNAILSLSAPTDKAAKLLTELGVTTVDAEGNLRPMQDILGELSTSLDGLGSAERADVISQIFNKTDIAAVNALLDTGTDRWNELTAAIDESKGAADAMANTQLDNLAGDVTLFKSALEGAQLLISDALTPDLRKFVQFGTEGLTKVSDAFKQGGLTGAMEAFGEVLSDGIAMITKMLPDAIKAGMELLGAVGKGIIDNLPVIVDASVQIITELVKGLVEALPELAKGALTIIESLGQALMDNSGELLQAGVDLLTTLWDGIVTGLPELTTKAVEIINTLAQGISENLPQLLEVGLNALMEFTGSLRENAGLLIDAGLNLIMKLAEGLIDSLPVLIETLPTIVSNIAGIINDNAPKLIACGIELIGKLIVGIVQAIPTLIAEFPKIVKAIFDVIAAVNWVNLGSSIIKGIASGVKSLVSSIPDALKNIAQKGFDIVKNTNWKFLGTHLIQMIGTGIRSLLRSIPDLLKNIGKQAINAFKSIDWKSVGSNIIKGIIAGITSGVSSIVNAAKNAAQSAFRAAKSVLGISSPSKKFMWMGEMVDEGFAKGIEDNKQLLSDTVGDLFNFDNELGNMGGSYTSSNSVLSNLASEGGAGRDMTIVLELDRVQFAKAVYKFNNEEVQRVGVNLAGGYA